MGEAMHALGIPTTRALAAVATGATVQRAQILPGAILTRVAASHLRVAPSSTSPPEATITRCAGLADYAITRHDVALASTPPLPGSAAGGGRAPGFVGRPLDGRGLYPRRHEHRQHDDLRRNDRLRPFALSWSTSTPMPYSAQSTPQAAMPMAISQTIAQWNWHAWPTLCCPLIDADAESAANAPAAVEAFAERFDFHWTSVLRPQAGLGRQQQGRRALADDYLKLMSQYRIDFALAFARLADAAQRQRHAASRAVRRHGRCAGTLAEALARAHPGGRHEPSRTGGGPAERQSDLHPA